MIGYVYIPKLTEEILKSELIKYINRGKQLRTDNQYISENIHNEVMRDAKTPRLFYFIEASSGLGKSQLAESLSMPVIYIPLTTTQKIYKCFSAVSEAAHDVVTSDYNRLRSEFGDSLRSSNILMNFSAKLRTAGLLLSLFKEVYGKTNEESFKILSGYNGKRILRYTSKSIMEAENEIQESLFAARIKKLAVPVFFIDEVPSHEDTNAHNDCIFLRNIIRSMNCICIMSGTEAALLDAFEKSRREGMCVDDEYFRLISKLPITNWEIICSDSKYAQLIPYLSPDLCDMLRATRPLFVEYVLDAMLEERLSPSTISQNSPTSSGELTAVILSRVKKMVLKKERFTSLGGLYGQIAMLHEDFISLSVEELLEAKIGNSDYLRAQKQFCIRHHFGKMHIKDSEDSILSLYVAPRYLYIGTIGSSFSGKYEVRPNIAYERACDDPLLYLICIRDGLYWTDAKKKEVRVSSSFALSLLANDRLLCDTPLFAKTRQSCKFHEMEAVFAAIVSSHSYQNSRSGCPLDFFLRSVIGELNAKKDYVVFDNINGIPPVYKDLRIEVLFPSSISLQENSESISQWQHNEIFLGSCLLSNNTFPLLSHTVSILMGPLESKCKEYDDQMQELINTIGSNVPHNRSIKILIVGKLAISLSNDKKFNRVEVVLVRGNACKGQEVATELQWKSIRGQQGNKRTRPECTLVVIELDSIYYDRQKCMKFAY